MSVATPRDMRSGRFVSASRTAPEVTLNATTVPLANGRQAALTAGQWDAATAEAYQEGQCLALAVAVVESLGENARVGYLYREDDELAHAVALVEDRGVEWAVDSYGWMPAADLCATYDISPYDLDRVTAEQARADAEGFALLPAQDFSLASSFAQHVTAMRA